MPASQGSQSSQHSSRQGSQSSRGSHGSQGSPGVFETPTKSLVIPGSAIRKGSCGVVSPEAGRSLLSATVAAGLGTTPRLVAPQVITKSSSQLSSPNIPGAPGAQNTMGYTRSGTPYSPSAKAGKVPRNARQKSLVKRVDKSGSLKSQASVDKELDGTAPLIQFSDGNSSNMEDENIKNNDGGTSVGAMDVAPVGFSVQGAITADDFMSQMKSQMETMIHNSLGEVITKSVEIAVQKSMKDNIEITVNNAVEQAVLKVKQEFLRETTKNAAEMGKIKEIANKQRDRLDAVEKSVAETSSALTEHKNDTNQKLAGADAVFDSAMTKTNQRLQEIHDRLDALDKQNESLNTKVSDVSAAMDINESNPFPHYRSLMMYGVLLKRTKNPMTPDGAASLVINDALGLKDVEIVAVQDMGMNTNGKNTLKVLLKSQGDCIKVLKKKSKLGLTPLDDIRNIWIQQSKTEEQRMMERNCGVLLRNSNIRNKFRQNRGGRIVPIQRDNESSAENDLNVDENWDESEDDHSWEQASTRGQRGRGRSRGRGRGGRSGGDSRQSGPEQRVFGRPVRGTTGAGTPRGRAQRGGRQNNSPPVLTQQVLDGLTSRGTVPDPDETTPKSVA